jgi:hypothetical protein
MRCRTALVWLRACPALARTFRSHQPYSHGYAATMSDSILDVVGKLGHLEMSAGVRETFQYCNSESVVLRSPANSPSGQ